MKPRPTAEQAARYIAYTVRILGKRMPDRERWLKKYEARHGPVDPRKRG
jgi:hypothetical protein